MGLAIGLYSFATSKKNEDYHHYCESGKDKYEIGDYKGAIEDYNTAINLKSDDASA